jgi:hypothetical protein
VKVTGVSPGGAAAAIDALRAIALNTTPIPIDVLPAR